MQTTESKARIVYNVPGLIKQYIEHVSYGFLTAELVKRDWGHTALIFKLNKALVGNKDLCIDVNGHVFTGKDPSILKVDTTAGLTLTGKDLYLDGTAAHLSRTAAPVTMRIMCNHFVDGLTRKRISAETIEYEIEATTENCGASIVVRIGELQVVTFEVARRPFVVGYEVGNNYDSEILITGTWLEIADIYQYLARYVVPFDE